MLLQLESGRRVIVTCGHNITRAKFMIINRRVKRVAIDSTTALRRGMTKVALIMAWRFCIDILNLIVNVIHCLCMCSYI